MKKVCGDDNEKIKEWVGISLEDTQCNVMCTCGENFSVSDFHIFRCPKCKKGYRTEFVVWQYEPEETDTSFQEESVWNQKIKEIEESSRLFILKLENEENNERHNKSIYEK